MNLYCVTCDENIDKNNFYLIKEMMYGFREEFKYYLCDYCGCLHIANIPKDLNRFYPKDYYSYNKPIVSINKIINYIKNKRASYCIGNKSIIGMFVSIIYGIPDWHHWFKKIDLEFTDKILDVGSGGGDLLLNMNIEGFCNLYGVDPYINEDIYYSNQLQIFKKNVFDVENKFDFIMLNHSFEHMANPLCVLKKLYSILEPQKYLLIRIPVIGTHAWRTYNVDWFSLDAPRHLHIQSLISMNILAEKSGFTLKNIVFDSSENQFWGSEQYKNNIPLYDERSYLINKKNSMFSKKDINQFKKDSKKLNINNDGDSAIFYLYKN